MEFSKEAMETSEGRLELLKALDYLSNRLVIAEKELPDACFIAQLINGCEPELAQAVFDAYSAVKEARDWIDCAISGTAEIEIMDEKRRAADANDS